MKTTKPKTSDVWWMTKTLTPVTKCDPPEGSTCFLSRGATGYTAAEAKRHALENPGHFVERESITRSSYCLDSDGTQFDEEEAADLPGPKPRGVQNVRTVLDADELAQIDEEKARADL